MLSKRTLLSVQQFGARFHQRAFLLVDSWRTTVLARASRLGLRIVFASARQEAINFGARND
jgi:hypothetical protein